MLDYSRIGIQEPEMKEPEMKDGILSGYFDPVNNPVKMIEVLSKILIVFTALCYFLGLIIININLSGYGIYFFDLFKVSYITAGLWFLLPMIVLLLLYLVIFFSIKKIILDIAIPLIKKRKKPILKSIFPFLGVLFFFYIVVVYSYIFRNDPVFAEVKWVRLDLFLLVLLITSLLVFVLLLVSYYSKSKAIMLTFCSGSIIPFIVGMLYFAEFVYDEIPKYLGGGRPIKAALVLEVNNNVVSLLNHENIYIRSFGDEKKGVKQENFILTTDNVNVVLETDKEIFITKNGHLIGLPRDCIKAIAYKNRIQALSFEHGGDSSY
jgi:hypothetical protein